MEQTIISHRKTLPGVTVIGKINLPSKSAARSKKKRKFTPFSGGATIGAILKSQGISLR